MEEKLKIGDLVETCQMIPGFVIWIDPNNSDEIEVQAFDRLDKYQKGKGACHSVKHCGVHKISQFRAMCLNALGEEKLKELYEDESFDYEDTEALYKIVKELRNNNEMFV